jgi:hypothetical protein
VCDEQPKSTLGMLREFLGLWQHKKSMVTLAKIKLIEILFISICLSNRILILLVSSSKSGIKQIEPLIKQKMYTISNMALATLHFVVPKTKKNKKSPFWKFTFFLKLLSIKVSYNQNNIKYSRVNVQAQAGIIFLKFN